jgi:hypothetical protein
MQVNHKYRFYNQPTNTQPNNNCMKNHTSYNLENAILLETKAQRNGRHIEFTMPANKYDPRSVMIAHGYHPAGYGQPFDIKDDSFKCSSSSD